MKKKLVFISILLALCAIAWNQDFYYGEDLTLTDDLSVGDDATVTGDLDVDGATTLDDTTIEGTLDLTGVTSDIALFSDSEANYGLLLDGYITATGANVYGKIHVDDTNDALLITRESTDIVGMDVQMPFSVGQFTDDVGNGNAGHKLSVYRKAEEGDGFVAIYVSDGEDGYVDFDGNNGEEFRIRNLDGDIVLNAKTGDEIVCDDPLVLVSVDDDAMDATNCGTVGALVYNTDDSKAYVCTTAGTPGTWAALN